MIESFNDLSNLINSTFDFDKKEKADNNRIKKFKRKKHKLDKNE